MLFLIFLLLCCLSAPSDLDAGSNPNLSITKATASKQDAVPPWAAKEKNPACKKEGGKIQNKNPVLRVTFGEKINCRILPK